MTDPISNIYTESVINKDKQIKKWLEHYTSPVMTPNKHGKMEVKLSTFTIDSNGLVSVNGNFDFFYDKLKKIPVQFLKVTECFYTSISITSLAGCPKFVGTFYCYGNKNLTNLIGGPEEVKGRYDCSSCTNLTSLEGAPKFVGGGFYCYKCNNLPYSELFKIVDIVEGDIFYKDYRTPEDKNAIRHARDIHMNLQHDELGNLDV